jgi:hypothetical protein
LLGLAGAGQRAATGQSRGRGLPVADRLTPDAVTGGVINPKRAKSDNDVTTASGLTSREMGLHPARSGIDPVDICILGSEPNRTGATDDRVVAPAGERTDPQRDQPGAIRPSVNLEQSGRVGIPGLTSDERDRSPV